MSERVQARGRRVLLTLCAGLTLAACSLGGSDSTPTRPPTAVARVNTPSTAGTVPIGETMPSTPDAAPAGETTSPVDDTPRALAGTAIASATVEPVETVERVEATVSPAAPTVEPTPEPTAAATPLPAGYRRFTSKINPYSIGYPRGWRAQANAFRFGNIRGDLFVTSPRGSVVSINVLAEPLRGQALSTAEYVRLNLEQIGRASGSEPKRSGTVRVAGSQAALITWEDRSRPQQVFEITQAIWTEGDRGWVVTLANPRGQRARYLPVFREILGTMQLRQAGPSVE